MGRAAARRDRRSNGRAVGRSRYAESVFGRIDHHISGPVGKRAAANGKGGQRDRVSVVKPVILCGEYTSRNTADRDVAGRELKRVAALGGCGPGKGELLDFRSACTARDQAGHAGRDGCGKRRPRRLQGGGRGRADSPFDGGPGQVEVFVRLGGIVGGLERVKLDAFDIFFKPRGIRRRKRRVGGRNKLTSLNV